jgi:hypothetical protein
MEMSRENPLCSYLKHIKMYFLKNREHEDKTGLFLGVGTSGRGEDIRKGCRRVNVVEMLCIHV